MIALGVLAALLCILSMSRYQRPKYPKPDTNHDLVPVFCERLGYRWQGLLLKPMDTSKLGGEFLDWILNIGPLPVYIEVKTPEAYRKPNHDMTPGERDFFTNYPDIPKAIVSDYQQMADALDKWGPVAIRLQEILGELDGN